MAGLMFASAAGMGHVRYLYARENKRRARVLAGWTPAELSAEHKSEVRRGEQRLYHRLML